MGSNLQYRRKSQRATFVVGSDNCSRSAEASSPEPLRGRGARSSFGQAHATRRGTDDRRPVCSTGLLCSRVTTRALVLCQCVRYAVRILSRWETAGVHPHERDVGTFTCCVYDTGTRGGNSARGRRCARGAQGDAGVRFAHHSFRWARRTGAGLRPFEREASCLAPAQFPAAPAACRERR